MEKSESLAENDEMNNLVRIARRPIQFTEANITKDPQQRQNRLDTYLRSAQLLIGNVVMAEGVDHYGGPKAWDGNGNASGRGPSERNIRVV